ncbi:MAG: hypothetical protein DI598_11430 [Pseudopedobacter saltans]|uniref:Uncharacterized protein n=1 Tax=Pseudopedobacter saltans TaxID=151895 RepID=A0A2W5GMT3_9SPHI|nr:MAG: hypothetical protein DI598_11430 [Pseudopedobacter saltans]
MRKLILVTVTCIFVGCSSPEDKAKSLIEEDMKVTLHDYESYEPVSYSGLSDAYSDVEHDSEAPKLIEESKRLKEKLDRNIRFEREMTYLEAPRKEILKARAEVDEG